MSITVHGHDDLVWDDLEGERPRGCLWDEAVCTSAPTHHITPPPHGPHHDEPATYCRRHYVLALARAALVHLPGCPHPTRAHIASHGPLS